MFCNAKILSDIRPIFGPKIESGPVAAVVTHTLKLGYHEEGEHKQFFVVLDDADLVTFQEVIQRAREKSDALDNLLGASKLPRLGV